MTNKYKCEGCYMQVPSVMGGLCRNCLESRATKHMNEVMRKTGKTEREILDDYYKTMPFWKRIKMWFIKQIFMAMKL